MPISPRAPVAGPVNFDYPHGDDFVPPPHLIKQTPLLEADPSLLPNANIDTSFYPADILATEPAPKVRPIFIGLRRALASRRIEKSNTQLRELEKKHGVVRYVGEAMLTNRLYNDAEIDGQPNLNRPVTRSEIKAAERLDKIATKRRRIGGHAHAKSQSLTTPVRASRAEIKHARTSDKHHAKALAKMDRLDDKFRKVVGQPAKRANRITARRNRAVAKREALDQAAERRAAQIEQVRDDVTGSARALGQEVAESYQESLNITKEQMERLRHTAAYKSGQLAVKGTVALTSFYKEVGQNAGKLYLQGGKHIAKKTARYASQTAVKAKSKVRPKKS